MRTAIVSDLHLGVGTSIDLLRSSRFREALGAELGGVDRVVLLGDVIELRDRPLVDALDAARPVLAWLGEAVGDGEVVLVAGNHDHHLVAPWLERRALGGDGLELEHEVEPDDAALRALVEAAAPARIRVAYPGTWVRSDVYATHGHYLDRHLTIPTLERLGVAAVERLLGTGPPEQSEQATAEPGGPAAYEQVQTPVYEFLFALAQATLPDRRGAGGGASVRAWQLLTGKDSRAARIRGWLLGSVALPGAVGVANRLGFGPVRSELTPDAITAAGLEAIGEVVGRLDIAAEHIIFGHTHRRGPLAADPPWIVDDIRLWNTGSWVFSPALVGRSGSRSPYWPGTVAIVGDDGPPELIHTLDDWSAEEIESAAST